VSKLKLHLTQTDVDNGTQYLRRLSRNTWVSQVLQESLWILPDADPNEQPTVQKAPAKYFTQWRDKQLQVKTDTKARKQQHTSTRQTGDTAPVTGNIVLGAIAKCCILYVQRRLASDHEIVQCIT